MRVCIHRGSHEIGGNCVEIESQRQRLVLDVGLPLGAPREEATLPAVAGFLEPDPSLLGVIISHVHLDHFGLLTRVRPEVPRLVGTGGRKILEAAALFTGTHVDFSHAMELKDRRPLTMGPFRVTPFLMDHSAYDAYAIMVEADGHRLFYSGDFRGHGRKAVLFERLLAMPPQAIDVLLMEGSTLGRTGIDDQYPTEDELESQLVVHFRAIEGVALVCCSGQNIDRLVTVYRAALRSGRQFIADMYTACVLRAPGQASLPQPGHDNFRVFTPASQRRAIKRAKQFEVVAPFRNCPGCRIYSEHLAKQAARSVMLFRASMISDLEEAECLHGASLIWSLWSGYLKDESSRPLLEWLERRGIPLTHCHTSGHAPAADLKRLVDALTPKVVVPIHCNEPARFADLFDHVAMKCDGQWWDVGHES